CVVVTTKFIHGAWIVLTAIPIVILLMRAVHAHYTAVAHQLADEDRRPVDRRPGHQHLVIFVTNVDAAYARAIGYGRSVRPSSLVAVTADPSVHAACKRLARDIEVHLLPSDGNLRNALMEYLHDRRARLSEDEFLTVMIPEVLEHGGLTEILRRPGLHRLKGRLLNERGIQVMDVPIVKDAIDPAADQARESARNYVVVLVSSVHNATLQAMEYAETLRPTDLRAVSFGLDPAETEKLGDDWLAAAIPHPLEIDDAPFRDIGRSLIDYIRPFDADGVDIVVTVVLPEFVTKKRRHRVLHGQTALIVKRHLLFEPGVVTASVPYHLDR
ncbi:MAG: hypothetical protein ACRDKT_08800, partial [Actinomycetota bacterium]